jgi:hypothetical protein
LHVVSTVEVEEDFGAGYIYVVLFHWAKKEGVTPHSTSCPDLHYTPHLTLVRKMYRKLVLRVAGGGRACELPYSLTKAGPVDNLGAWTYDLRNATGLITSSFPLGQKSV